MSPHGIALIDIDDPLGAFTSFPSAGEGGGIGAVACRQYAANLWIMRVAHKLQQAPQARRTFDLLQADIFTHYGHGSVVSDLEGLKTVGGFEQLLNRIEGWRSSGPGFGSSRSSEKTSLGSDPPALGCSAGRCSDVVLIEDTDHYPGCLDRGASLEDLVEMPAQRRQKRCGSTPDHEANLRPRPAPRRANFSLYEYRL